MQGVGAGARRGEKLRMGALTYVSAVVVGDVLVVVVNASPPPFRLVVGG
jgi:hypothetical protein